MKLRVLYHGHCFDGVASAATFTRFYTERINAHADVEYAGLLHRPGNLFDQKMFDGDENAIVDFKYSPSEKLTWWFDHHQSAFLTPEDEAHFHAENSDKKFLDATRKSCTEFTGAVCRAEGAGAPANAGDRSRSRRNLHRTDYPRFDPVVSERSSRQRRSSA